MNFSTHAPFDKSGECENSLVYIISWLWQIFCTLIVRKSINVAGNVKMITVWFVTVLEQNCEKPWVFSYNVCDDNNMTTNAINLFYDS